MQHHRLRNACPSNSALESGKDLDFTPAKTRCRPTERARAARAAPELGGVRTCRCQSREQSNNSQSVPALMGSMFRCSPQITGRGRRRSESCSLEDCRPFKIASTISGANKVKRKMRHR